MWYLHCCGSRRHFLCAAPAAACGPGLNSPAMQILVVLLGGAVAILGQVSRSVAVGGVAGAAANPEAPFCLGLSVPAPLPARIFRLWLTDGVPQLAQLDAIGAYRVSEVLWGAWCIMFGAAYCLCHQVFLVKEYATHEARLRHGSLLALRNASQKRSSTYHRLYNTYSGEVTTNV